MKKYKEDDLPALKGAPREIAQNNSMTLLKSN